MNAPRGAASLAALTALALSNIARAETQPSEAPPPEVRLGEVLVEARRIRESAEDPASYTTVIEPAQFESQFRTLPELLSREVGVNVRQFGGLGQLSTVSIRGSSAEQVLVLIDGVRINAAEGGAVDFSTIPLDSVERVEITRGGGAAVYGSDAVGGVINIVTKRPSEALGGSASASYGSFRTIRESATASGGAGEHAFLLSHAHFQSEGDFRFREQTFEDEAGNPIFDPADPPKRDARRINNDFFSESLLGKYVWRPSSRFRLTALDDFFLTERGQPGFASLEERQLRDARQRLRRNVATVSAEADDAGLDGLRATLQLSHRAEWIDFRDTDPSLAVGTIDTSTLDQSAAARLRLELPFSTLEDSALPVNHYLALSAEYRRDMFEDRVRNPSQEGFGREARDTYAVFVQDEMTFFEERLSIIPAYRFDATTFEDASNWQVRAALRPWPWLTVKGGYETTFRQPNFSELFFPDQGFLRGNPDLRPEEGETWDVGASVGLSWLFAEAVYFRSRIDNQVFFLPVSPFTVEATNTGPVDVEGVEATLELVPLDWLALSANYTHQAVVSRETREQLATRPEDLANFRGTIRGEPGEVYVEVQYVSDIPLDSIGAVFVVERAQVDVGGTLNLLWLPYLDRLAGAFGKLTAGVDVKNLGDEDFADARGAPLPGLSVFGKVFASF